MIMPRNGMFKTSLDYYKSFYYVAKFKSISLAAKQLDLTQPSMSSSIKKMEQDLGCKLFERTRNGAELTEEGRILWEKIEPACELILEAETALETSRNHSGGTLNIVAYEQGYLLFVMPALKMFLHDHPDVKVNLLSRPQERMTEMVRIGLADLTILFSPIKEEDEFRYTYIGTIGERFAAGSEYSDLKDRKVSVEELAGYPLITYSSGTAKAYLQKWFEKNDVIFQPQMEVTGVSLMKQSIIDNYGIGDVLPPMTEKEVKEGKMFYLDLNVELPLRRVYAVTRKEQNYNTRIFLEEYMTRITGGVIPEN